MNIREAASTYINYRRAVGEKYITGAKHLNRLIKFVGEDVELEDVTADTVTDYYTEATNRLTLHGLSVMECSKGSLYGRIREVYATISHYRQRSRNIRPVSNRIFTAMRNSNDCLKRL